jgi:hypothetical protein
MGSTNNIRFLYKTVLHKTHVRTINFDIIYYICYPTEANRTDKHEIINTKSY